MAIGHTNPSNVVPANTPIDEASLSKFLSTINIPPEEWQKRLAALSTLVQSIPDYSATPTNNDDDKSLLPWYRSSKHVRRLFPVLKTYVLDARSAVVKEAAELIGTLFVVKLQIHPNHYDNNTDNNAAATVSPPPPFIGKLLLKDLLPPLLQLSSQTVKTIRNYGNNLLLEILPHCRVVSMVHVLCERLKSDKHRVLKEDCCRYLRCVLETWPCEERLSQAVVGDEDKYCVNVTAFRKDECLTVDIVRQIGVELGRSLSDPAMMVRNEGKLGFQILFRRFRPIWDDVMHKNSGVIRDARLRKKLLEAAARSDGRDVDDVTIDDGNNSIGGLSYGNSVGGMSYGSMRSGISQLTFRTHASRTNGRGGGAVVPNTIGASKSKPHHVRNMQTSREATNSYSTNTYVTSSGQVLSTPSPKNITRSYNHRSPRRNNGSSSSSRGGGSGIGRGIPLAVTEQPFASLLKTPLRNDHETMSPIHQMTPLGLKPEKASSTVLRKRLSRRISGVVENNNAGTTNGAQDYNRQLSSIYEAEDIRMQHTKSEEEETTAQSQSHQQESNNSNTTNPSEITTVALEVITAHLSHLKHLEESITREKELLSNLEKLTHCQSPLLDADALQSKETIAFLSTLTEEQVCDYFESLHVCVNEQLDSNELLLGEMEKISQGDAM